MMLLNSPVEKSNWEVGEVKVSVNLVVLPDGVLV